MTTYCNTFIVVSLQETKTRRTLILRPRNYSHLLIVLILQFNKKKYSTYSVYEFPCKIERNTQGIYFVLSFKIKISFLKKYFICTKLNQCCQYHSFFFTYYTVGGTVPIMTILICNSSKIMSDDGRGWRGNKQNLYCHNK